MPASHDPIRSLLAHLECRSTGRSARTAMARWRAVSPGLAPFASPADIAAEGRRRRAGAEDQLIAELLAVAAGDDLAQLTVVGALAGRLAGVAAAWVRAGLPPDERHLVAADLISGCWQATVVTAALVAAGAPVPARVTWHLVDEAREAVRVVRRRERRRADRHLPLVDRPAPPAEPSSTVELAVVLADAVRDGRISRGAAVPVFLTRVVGVPVVEVADRLGCSPAALRVRRARAEHALIAAATAA